MLVRGISKATASVPDTLVFSSAAGVGAARHE